MTTPKALVEVGEKINVGGTLGEIIEIVAVEDNRTKAKLKLGDKVINYTKFAIVEEEKDDGIDEKVAREERKLLKRKKKEAAALGVPVEELPAVE